jgi:hypothetical protein
MTHQRMMDRAPSCAILHNRNELKVYQGNQVYLNDGDNFELRFFNPTNFKIGVEINFNGINKGDGYLVLNPGQDLILDRFLDEQRKMLFETYVVDGNNDAAVKAIQQNGVINFNFYKENSYRHNYQDNSVNIKYNFPPKPPKPPKHLTPNYGNTYVTNNYYGVSISGSTGWSGTGGVAGVYGAIGVAGPAGAPGYCYSTKSSGLPHFTNVSSTYNSNPTSYQTPGIFINETDNSTFTTSSTLDSLNYSDYVAEHIDNNIAFSEYIAFNPLETGRIEKGDISSQTSKSVNAQFQSKPFHSITYKLMPISSMNRTVKEVRAYCGSCGYRLRKSSWQFCPSCGEKNNRKK